MENESIHDFEYVKSLCCEMKKLRDDEKFCDAVLISGVDGRKINVHRLVLSASSVRFASLFASSRTDDNKITELTIKDVDGDFLEELINFCYTGSIEIKLENVENLFLVSKKLELSRLNEICVNFLAEKINLMNFMKILSLAERKNSKKLEESVNCFMKQNFKEISKSQQFLGLTSAQLCQLIKSNELNVASEEEVFHALMSWYNCNVENRKIYVPGLLAVVRMSQLSTEFINEHVRSVCETLGCQELLIEPLFKRLLPKNPTKINENLLKPRTSQKNETLFAVGWNENQYGSDILRYSMETKKWSLWLIVSHGGRLGGCCLWNEKLFLIDSYSLICLNIQTKKLESFKNFKMERKWSELIVFEEHLFVLGGIVYNEKRCNIVEKWNPKTDKWSYVPDMKTKRNSFGVVVLNGLLFVVGGFNVKCLNETECFNAKLNSWINLSSMNERRCAPGVTTDGRFIYSVGGVNEIYSKTVEFYDPQIDKWTLMLSSLHDPRMFSGCIFFDGRLFVAGGSNKNDLKTVEVYDPKTKKWYCRKSLVEKYYRVHLLKSFDLKEN